MFNNSLERLGEVKRAGILMVCVCHREGCRCSQQREELQRGGPGDKNWGVQWSSASGAVCTGPISLNTVPWHMCTANRDTYLVFKVQSVVGAQFCDRWPLLWLTLASSPSRGWADATWTRFPTTSHFVSIDYVARPYIPSSPPTKILLSVDILFYLFIYYFFFIYFY